MVNRIATFAFTEGMIASNTRLQAKYADINTQISSGLKSPDYKGISRDSQYLLAIESTQSKIAAYNANANTTLATVNTMYSTTGRIDDLANSMLTTVTSALAGGLVPGSIVTAQADNALNEMAGLLNLRIAGRYIFSGSDIDTKPVDLTDPAWTPQVPPSTVNSSYYQGNSFITSVQVSETLNVNYGITADNSAFEGLFRAYNLLKNNPTNQVAITEASTLIQNSIRSLANMRGILSTQAKSMESQVDKNSQDTIALTTLTATIKEVDIPTASVQLTGIQSQLEASYSSSVRLLNLNLVSYLR